jgi:hypothetical protein
MKKKKQKYSNLIPALALLGGGAYLLLSKKSTPSSSGAGNNTNTTTTTTTTTATTDKTSFNPFIVSPTLSNTTILNSQNTKSEVAGIELVRGEGNIKPDFNTWRGYQWYSYVNELSKKMSKKDAIRQAFNEWNNPENKYYSFMPNEASFLLGLAMAERMPYYQKKGFVESGDYGHINTGADKIGTISVDRPIKWDSQPVYDTYYGWWYDVEAWGCQDWVDWHKALERKYNSTAKANDIWRSAWFSEQNSGANAVIENNWYYCPRDCANFVKYFASKGITDTGGGILAPVYCDLSSIVQNIVGGVSDLSEGVSNTTKVLKYAVPVLVIAVGYFAYKRVTARLKKVT